MTADLYRQNADDCRQRSLQARTAADKGQQRPAGLIRRMASSG
jgi:hypothetical protein